MYPCAHAAADLSTGRTIMQREQREWLDTTAHISTSSLLVTGMSPGTDCHLAASACAYQRRCQKAFKPPVPASTLARVRAMRAYVRESGGGGGARGREGERKRGADEVGRRGGEARSGKHARQKAPAAAQPPFAVSQAGARANSASIGRNCTLSERRGSRASGSRTPPCLRIP